MSMDSSAGHFAFQHDSPSFGFFMGRWWFRAPWPICEATLRIFMSLSFLGSIRNEVLESMPEEDYDENGYETIDFSSIAMLMC